MCLSTLYVRGPKFGIGYKVLHAHKKQLNGVYKGGRVKTGVWLKDKNEQTLYTEDNDKYPTGFHIYTTQKAAKELAFYKNNLCEKHQYFVYKVRYRKVVAFGTNKAGYTNQTYDCVVAKEIKVLGRDK